MRATGSSFGPLAAPALAASLALVSPAAALTLPCQQGKVEIDAQGVARSLTKRHPRLAEDAMQEALLAFSRFCAKNKIDNPDAWLQTVALNKLIEEIEKEDKDRRASIRAARNREMPARRNGVALDDPPALFDFGSHSQYPQDSNLGSLLRDHQADLEAITDTLSDMNKRKDDLAEAFGMSPHDIAVSRIRSLVSSCMAMAGLTADPKLRLVAIRQLRASPCIDFFALQNGVAKLLLPSLDPEVLRIAEVLSKQLTASQLLFANARLSQDRTSEQLAKTFNVKEPTFRSQVNTVHATLVRDHSDKDWSLFSLQAVLFLAALMALGIVVVAGSAVAWAIRANRQARSSDEQWEKTCRQLAAEKQHGRLLRNA